jgi:hypothetical protein
MDDRLLRRPDREMEPPLTIAAAAICRDEDGYAVIGIADRKLTAADDKTGYQPRMTKFHCVGSNVVSMSAGDGDYAIEIARMLTPHLKYSSSEAAILGSVAEVAESYAKCHSAIRNRRSEGFVLTPIGLDLERLVGGQHGLPESVITNLLDRIWDSDFDLKTESLICGIDSTGERLFRVTDPGYASPYDRGAFYAIGSGATHFETFFTTREYDRSWGLMNALLLMFSAKRLSEADPFVGGFSDMFIIRKKTGLKVLSREQVGIIDANFREFTAGRNEVYGEVVKSLAQQLSESLAKPNTESDYEFLPLP